MDTTNTWSGLLRALVSGTLLVPLAPAGPAMARDVTVDDTFVVIDRRNGQLHPRIDGRHVVWQDYRDIGRRDGDARNADIWGRNLDSSDEFMVEANRTSSHPDVSGNVVIYADGRNGDADIRGYNVRRGEHFWVIRRAGSDQDRPAISGNLVVWQDNRDGKWSIRGVDLDRDEEFWVSRRDSNQTNPRVDGSVVVWEDDRDGCCDVYSRDLDSGDVTRVTDSNDAREPSVSGDWVVYRRERRSHDLIEAYNLATGERLQLNQNTTDRRGQPSVSDRIAVWSDRRNDEDFNVYGYDLEAGAEFPIARLDDNQQAPAVSGNHVVWTDDRGDRGTQIRGASLAIPGDEPEDDVEVAGEQVMPAPPLAGAVAAGECEFLLGFRMLRDKAPAAVGECLENEWHNAENGDGLQRTTNGLLVWRKADNWTAFTDGSITWLNGPCGLQTRPNEGPYFAWEGYVGGVCF